MTASSHYFLFCLFAVALLFSSAQSTVPSSKQFKYVNDGELGDYIVEYNGNYRFLSPFNSPFQLCFYNTTPNAFTLALRMGLVRSESRMRWVWEANRGHPVGDNATFSLGANGNLVLANADGRVAWQSNTANKGVVGFRLLSNGNMVLHDSKGKYIWQSFDHHTDTLLVGQSLRAGSVPKLVSRISEQVNSNGPYSLVLESNALALYYQTKNSPKPYPYYKYNGISVSKGTLGYVTFISRLELGTAYGLGLYCMATDGSEDRNAILARPKYNATLSYLRLGIDGNINVYTYNNEVDYGAWEATYTLFSRDRESECQLPERCGNFGLCEDNQCVACPSPNGLAGWSKNCEPPKLPACGNKNFGYYRLQGVDHFMTKYADGYAIKESECGNKCSGDCKCAGYFYNQETSRCWIANDLKTISRASKLTHLGYVKFPKN